MNQFEKAVQDLQTEVRARFDELEQGFEEIKRLGGVKGDRGPAGPQGKPGNIDAAVQNTELRAREVMGEAAKVLDAKLQTHNAQVAAQLTAIRSEFAAVKAQLAQTIENAVVNALVKTLREYQLLDEENNLHPGAVNHALGRLGVPTKPYKN